MDTGTGHWGCAFPPVSPHGVTLPRCHHRPAGRPGLGSAAGTPLGGAARPPAAPGRLRRGASGPPPGGSRARGAAGRAAERVSDKEPGGVSGVPREIQLRSTTGFGFSPLQRNTSL